MVDSYSSATPYSFEVDGKPYMLPGLAFDDIDVVAEAMGNDPAVQMKAAREILFSRADDRTKIAIGSMSIAGIGRLFRKWAGVEPGESSASPVFSEATDES